jgi:hypothetical protein
MVARWRGVAPHTEKRSMVKRLLSFAATAVVLSGSPAFGQTQDIASRILAAAGLPVSAAQAREEGTPGDVIGKILEAMKGSGVSAGEAHDVIDEERAARRENGPVDNFGEFVQSKLAAGLRGRDLAEAIRAEHAARGKGHGAANGKASAAGSSAGNAGRARGGHGRGAHALGGPDSAGAARSRGGPPSKQTAKDSAGSRGPVGGDHGAPGRGKRPDKPAHPNP